MCFETRLSSNEDSLLQEQRAQVLQEIRERQIEVSMIV